MALYPETLEVRQMEFIREPEPVSGTHMGTALLLILFSPSASETPHPCGMKDLTLGCLYSL